MKPWGRYEIDYLDHPKFRSLHANAVVLWWECKNYCDKFHTDGRFPVEVVKTFRHYSQKMVEQLTRSCGVKPNGEAYAPLLEHQDIGGVPYFVMHGYLEHNECRDKVLARIAKADAERDRKAANQQAYRDRQKRDVTGNESGHVTGNDAVTTPERSVTLPDKQKQIQKQVPAKEQQVAPAPTSRSKRPIFSGSRFTVFEWQLEGLERLLGANLEAFDLHAFFFELDERFRDKPVVIPQRDSGVWLLTQVEIEAKRRGLPIQAGDGRKAMFPTPVEESAKRVLEKIKQHDALIAGIQ